MLPSNDKQIGDSGHVADHNSIIDEINSLISSSANYLQVSSSSNFLFVDTASTIYSSINISINQQTSASYTLDITDVNKLIEMNNSNGNLIVIPLNSSVPFPIGTKIDLLQVGSGTSSVTYLSGVTLNSDTSKAVLNTQWSAASLIKRATDTWVLIGALK